MSEALSTKERIKPPKVKENLRTKILGQAIVYFQELNSTNDFAKELAVRGAREGTIVVAETQTMGKGRFKRKWISPENGLWFSIVLKPNAPLKHAQKLTLLASVAVAKTINRLYGLEAQIKWPNDVLINQKKVCGMLTESRIKGEKVDFAILGIGINANFNVESIPRHLREEATTLKEELGKEIKREILLCELLAEIESHYELFRRRRFEEILEYWRRLAGFLGSNVEVKSDEETVEGQAIDIDDDGALIIRLKDETFVTVTSGDIVKITHEDYPRYVDE